jgi:hypothetical protein
MDQMAVFDVALTARRSPAERLRDPPDSFPTRSRSTRHPAPYFSSFAETPITTGVEKVTPLHEHLDYFFSTTLIHQKLSSLFFLS